MAATLPKRFEPFVVPGGLKGQISELPVPDILQHLRAVAGDRHPHAGLGRRAQGALPQGRPRRVRLAATCPTTAWARSCSARARSPSRSTRPPSRPSPRASARARCWWRWARSRPRTSGRACSSRCKEIVYSVFQWDEGQFHFEESSLPEKERITVDLDIQDLILAGLRRVDAGGRIQARYPGGRLAARARDRRDVPAALEPYEEHVLELVDGERSVLEICRESEIGDNETLKVLYALLAHRRGAGEGQEGPHPGPGLRARGHASTRVLDSFNQMYGTSSSYMVREVGPIAENVLEKYLGDAARGAQGRLRRREAAEGRHPRRRRASSAT